MSHIGISAKKPEDITKDIEKFIDDNAKNYEDDNISTPNGPRAKLLQSMNFIKENKIQINYKARTDYFGTDVSVHMIKNKEIETLRKKRKIGTESVEKEPVEIGSFGIDKLGKTNSMSINVEDEEDSGIYRNKGLSRLLIASMIYVLQNKVNVKLQNADLLYIDADASAGFWDKIGMIENPHYDDDEYVGPDKGYEKYITVQGISMWCLGNSQVLKFGGTKRKTIRKKTKNNKTNKKSKNRKV